LTDTGAVQGLRKALGFTQQEMAQRLAELAWSMRGRRVGVNARRKHARPSRSSCSRWSSGRYVAELIVVPSLNLLRRLRLE
jgi:transcriptional regulator with XRE-family HTH domain